MGDMSRTNQKLMLAGLFLSKFGYDGLHAFDIERECVAIGANPRK